MTWQQTLSIIVAIVLSIASAIGFFWLNLPTKSDFNNLEAKMTTKEDLKTTETHLKEILGIYQNSTESLETDLKNHTSNQKLHASK